MLLTQIENKETYNQTKKIRKNQQDVEKPSIKQSISETDNAHINNYQVNFRPIIPYL